MVSYEGLFFDEKSVELIHSLEINRLDLVNNKIHCTFKYRPSEEQIFDEIVGKTFEIYLIGYANDGKNSGFKILLPNELRKYFINYDEENPSILKTPHITASLSKGANPTDTKKLKFNPIKPVKVIGTFGYWIKKDGQEYLSYEPYLNEKTK